MTLIKIHNSFVGDRSVEGDAVALEHGFVFLMSGSVLHSVHKVQRNGADKIKEDGKNLVLFLCDL